MAPTVLTDCSNRSLLGPLVVAEEGGREQSDDVMTRRVVFLSLKGRGGGGLDVMKSGEDAQLWSFALVLILSFRIIFPVAGLSISTGMS